ncbi:MAG TPA: hypothetical protein VGX92_10645 [Pyrinomonadaceae bacterium]|nr:hypothetical protein [Pyrinomonadaceae bacterium]
MDIIEGYKSAYQLTRQLITIATGVIALSTTFTKDILRGVPQKNVSLLKLSWLAYLLSVCFGMWAMMTLTGMIFKVSLQGVDSVRSNPYGSSFLPSPLQILSFIAGTVLIISYGLKALKNIRTTEAE